MREEIDTKQVRNKEKNVSEDEGTEEMFLTHEDTSVIRIVSSNLRTR